MSSVLYGCAAFLAAQGAFWLSIGTWHLYRPDPAAREQDETARTAQALGVLGLSLAASLALGVAVVEVTR